MEQDVGVKVGEVRDQRGGEFDGKLAEECLLIVEWQKGNEIRRCMGVQSGKLVSSSLPTASGNVLAELFWTQRTHVEWNRAVPIRQP